MMRIVWMCCFVVMTLSAGAATADELAGFQTKVHMPAVTLIDQHERPQSLEILFARHVVVVDVVFTQCRSVCPIMTAIMKRVQALVQAHPEYDIRLLSITRDPARDTPAALQQQAAKFGDPANWLWLTGAQADIDRVLQTLDVDPSAPVEAHPPVIYVGQGDRWYKWVGLPDAAELARAALRLATDAKAVTQ